MILVKGIWRWESVDFGVDTNLVCHGWPRLPFCQLTRPDRDGHFPVVIAAIMLHDEHHVSAHDKSSIVARNGPWELHWSSKDSCNKALFSDCLADSRWNRDVVFNIAKPDPGLRGVMRRILDEWARAGYSWP